MVWTKSQSAAINMRGRNILVSAAAGSGKTAVLAERIVRRVMRDRNRTDIDRMLVVTFTNAAAAEMRDRIGKKLREYKAFHALSAKKCRGRAVNFRLKSREEEISRRRYDMLLALDDASICTIDSFCNDCVRSFTHELNISPDFRLCDPAEDAVITEGAADTLFDRLYNEENNDFFELTRYYSSMRGDSELKAIVVMIYNFLRSYAEPNEKLDEIFRYYGTDEDIFRSEWAVGLMRLQKVSARRIISRLEAAKRRIEENMYSDEQETMLKNVIAPCIEAMSRLCAADESKGAEAWDEIYAITLAFLQSPPGRPHKSKKVKNVDALEEMQQLYDELILPRKYRKQHDLNYIVQSSDEAAEQFKMISRAASGLKWLVRELDREVRTVKQRRSVYSFSDIEHMTYKLITYPEYAEISAMYRQRYTDILIDEYQDTNGLQDAIFSGISDGKNMFMVGDLKQSIYAFRGGDPSIFKKKGAEYTPYESCEKNGPEPVRIDLSDNFRSNRSVVDSVNELFGYVMTDELGDVDYDREGERLRCGRESLDSDEAKGTYEGRKSEMVYLSLSGSEKSVENGETVGRDAIEARYVAQRIRDMVDSRMKICDGDEVRDIRYGDFTIIASSVRYLVNTYSDALGAKGIPLGIPMLGYYDFYEVSVVLSFLRVITNRRRDVPLAALMRSPIGGFTDEELAAIAMAVRGDDLYDRLVRVVRISRAKLKNGERDLPVDRALMEKTERFLRMIDRFDGYKHYKNAAAIVYAIYTETGFYDFVGAMDGGRMAQQNLTLLYEKAKKFESALSGGLYAFVKYIERLREDSDKEEGAAASDGAKDAVRMMTIHGSKGLEFPVVFMVSCGKNFWSGKSTNCLIDREAGVGLRYLDTEKKTYFNSPVFRYLKHCKLREARSEDMRKLYVGLTRAREKLICVMSGTDSADKTENNAAMSAEALLAQRSAGNSQGRELMRMKGFWEWLTAAYAAGRTEKRESAWYFDNDTDAGKYLSKDVFSIIRHRYRFTTLTALPSKTTVSKVKEEQNRNTDSSFEPRYYTALTSPARDKRSSVPANVLGTAYHKVMEMADPLRSMTAEGVGEQIEELRAAGYLASDVAEAIDPRLIAGFFNSEMGAKITDAYKAGRLYRETPFEMTIAPSEYEPGIDGASRDDEILVQGTIDCWFEDEDGRKTVIDYKTDAYRGGADDEKAKADFAKEKADEYAVQLMLYARALNIMDDYEKRMGKMEKYLYLFGTGCFKRVEEDE